MVKFLCDSEKMPGLFLIFRESLATLIRVDPGGGCNALLGIGFPST
jgi:hypothetical protein